VHEEAVFRRLREKLAELTAEHQSARVLEVSLWVGALSQFSGPEIQAHWSHAMAGTPAEGARLLITESSDLTHPHAQGIILENISLEEPV
jgi:hydrogenase nickel incorporation protein HypA/HybF